MQIQAQNRGRRFSGELPLVAVAAKAPPTFANSFSDTSSPDAIRERFMQRDYFPGLHPGYRNCDRIQALYSLTLGSPSRGAQLANSPSLTGL